MKHQIFKKSRLATSLSLILGVSVLSPVTAAESNKKDEIEVVQVKGIRGSLVKAMDIKRSSSGVVEAINAEDIGKFPDTNLAESLQRISGVSIDRQNGEGSKVTVRGFGADRNMVTLNGRQLPTTTGSRSFDFANIASEGVSGVEIYKTSNASVPTGGIGATINILTHRPLNNPGQKATFGLKTIKDTSTDKGSSATPEFSGLYSNTFADDTFGVSISGSYQERESGNQQANVGTGWRSFPSIADQDWSGSNAQWGGVPQDNQINRPTGADDIYGVPQTTIYRFEEQQRTRTNAQLVLQYQPIESLTATLDYTYVNQEVDTQYNDISAWFTFAPSENVWSDGPNSSPLLYSETYGSPQDLSMGAGSSGTEADTGSLGLNVKWEVTNNLTLKLDHHSSSAESTPNSPHGSANGLSMAAFIRTSASTDFTGDLPVLAVGGSSSIKPSDMRVTGSTFTNEQSKAEIDQTQLHGTYLFEETGSIDFGLSITDSTNHTQDITVQRNDWGGVGVEGDFDDSFFPIESVTSKFDQVSGGNFNDFDGDFEIVDTIYFWDFEKVRARAEQLYTPDSFAANTIVGDCGTLFCPSTQYDAATDQYTEEKMKAVYIQYNHDGEIGDMLYDVHFGVRYEETDITATSAVPTYDGAQWEGDTEIVLQATGIREFQTQKGSYSHTLPSFNFNLEVTEEVKLRVAYSQTIGRAAYDSLKGGTSVGSNASRAGGSGTAGNPSLLPLESTNYDFSAEWYYGEGSYASFGYFRKDVEYFIEGIQTNSNIYGIHNPVDGPRYNEAIAAVGSDSGDIRQYIFDNYEDGETVYMQDGKIIIEGVEEDAIISFLIDVPGNNEDEQSFDGIEMAVQHMFGESGFGLFANYTMVDTDNTYDNLALGGGQIAETNISDSANLVVFYEMDNFQTRIAYNWRDEFLNSHGQDTGANPKYTEDYRQIDFSISYDLPMVEGLTLSVEGINLTDEYTREHGRTTNQVLNVTQTGARYGIGARYTF
jgi:TonB-dependent receptor